MFGSKRGKTEKFLSKTLEKLKISSPNPPKRDDCRPEQTNEEADSNSNVKPPVFCPNWEPLMNYVGTDDEQFAEIADLSTATCLEEEDRELEDREESKRRNMRYIIEPFSFRTYQLWMDRLFRTIETYCGYGSRKEEFYFFLDVAPVFYNSMKFAEVKSGKWDMTYHWMKCYFLASINVVRVWEKYTLPRIVCDFEEDDIVKEMEDDINSYYNDPEKIHSVNRRIRPPFEIIELLTKREKEFVYHGMFLVTDEKYLTAVRNMFLTVAFLWMDFMDHWVSSLPGTTEWRKYWIELIALSTLSTVVKNSRFERDRVMNLVSFSWPRMLKDSRQLQHIGYKLTCWEAEDEYHLCRPYYHPKKDGEKVLNFNSMKTIRQTIYGND